MPAGESEDPAAVARRGFLDPVADGAVLLTSPDALMAQGLGYSSCSVGALIGPFQTTEGAPADTRASALGLLVGATQGMLVIDADEPESLALASQTHLPKCLVLENPSPMTVRSHLDRGAELLVTVSTCEDVRDIEHTSATPSRAEITIYRNGQTQQIAAQEVLSIRPTIEASPRQTTFATAILLSLGMSLGEIGACLKRAQGRHCE